MSIKVMSRVWEESKQKANKLLMLLALADNANDAGYAYPSVNTLAKKVRVNRRNAQKIIDALETDGEFIVYNLVSETKTQLHASNVYHLTRYAAETGSPPNLKGKLQKRGVVSPETLGSVARDTTVVSPETPDPSLEPSVNQSSIETPDSRGNFKELDAGASTATSSSSEASTSFQGTILLPANHPVFDEEPLSLYPCTPADVNALIGMWWEWTPIRPVRRGKVIAAKEHFGNTANREYAESLVQRGVVPADIATFLGEVRSDPDSRFTHLREKEMTFCYMAAALEEWVAEDRAQNWYTEKAPRITPRKPCVPILLGEIVDGENLLERMKEHPALIVDVPPRYISPHEAAADDEEDRAFTVDDATALNDLAEMGIDL